MYSMLLLSFFFVEVIKNYLSVSVCHNEKNMFGTLGRYKMPLICRKYLSDDNFHSLGILCRLMLSDFYPTLGRDLISFFFPGCMPITVSSM